MTGVPIRIVIADDQAMVRGALASLLELEADITVVAEVGDGAAALTAVRDLSPDVALLDIEMPVLDGIETARRIAELHDDGCRSLIVTTFGRPGYLRRALDAGASGFVVKDTPAAGLASAVRRIHAGQTVVDPELAQESLVSGPDPLTDRERDVLREARTGAGVRQIAEALSLSQGTVRNHLSSAIRKTHTSNRIEAAITAEARGWL